MPSTGSAGTPKGKGRGPATAKAAAPPAPQGTSIIVHVAVVLVACAFALGTTYALYPAQVSELVKNSTGLDVQAAVAHAKAAVSTGVGGLAATTASSPAANGVRVFTVDELAQYDGTDPSKPIYLAIVGRVFDVTKGSRFYGKEAGPEYNYFAGKDGTRTFITGEGFEGKESKEYKPHDITDFEFKMYGGVQSWIDTYETGYTPVGVLTMEDGYYLPDGSPTQRQIDLAATLKKSSEVQEDKKQEILRNPNCNSRWQQNIGGKLWCDDGRIPRRGKIRDLDDERCACYTIEDTVKFRDRLRVPDNCGDRETECPLPA